MTDPAMNRLFNAAKLAFRSEELGKKHAEGWGDWPTDVQGQVMALLEGYAFDTILDLGCGPGNYALLLKGWSRYVGIDQSATWLGLAKKRLAHLMGVELHQSWIEDFELKERVDLALCVDVFQHHAQPKVLAEKLASLDVSFLCFNFMVTDKGGTEDFFWDEWGKLSEGLTKKQADDLLEVVVKGMPAEVVGQVDLPYGEPLPQLTWKCFLLQRVKT